MLLARATAAIAAAMRLSLSRASSTTSSFSITAHAPRVPLPRAMSWTTTIQQQHSSPLSTIQRTRRRIVSVASSASSPPPSETSKLEPPDVRKLAKMAQLEVTDEEVADWEPKIRKIVSWFDQLQAVDLEAEEEKERLAEEQGGAQEEAGAELEKKKAFSLRADEVSQFGGDPADALREAPEKEGDFLKVPRIM